VAAVAVAAHISRIAEALPGEVLHISLTNEGFPFQTELNPAGS